MEKSPITLIGTQPTREQKIAATQSHPAKLDQFSTAIDILTQSYRLVSELCALYGVRPGGLETCYILGQSLLSVILAAGGDQAADTVEKQLRENLQESLGMVAGAVVAKLGARLGEGTVNALFVRRIGLRLKVYLCPIAK